MNCQLQLDGCDGQAVHKHHRQMRSQGGKDEDANFLDLCPRCHTYVHEHPKESYDHGWLCYSWQDPAKVPVIFPDKTVKAEPWSAWVDRWNEEEVEVGTPPESAVLQSWAVHGDTITDMVTGKEVTDAPRLKPHEGETCPVCQRRVPHAKKPSSPKTKVSSVRVPIDDAESFEEIVDAAAAHLGFKESPHWRYRTLLAGLVLALQEPADEN